MPEIESTRDEVMALLRKAEDFGITWWEASMVLEKHHGEVSGALSSLHREGVIYRLTEKRGKSKVYVLPRFCNGRTIEEYGRKKTCPHCGEEI